MAYRLLTVIQFKLGFDPMSNKKKSKNVGKDVCLHGISSEVIHLLLL